MAQSNFKARTRFLLFPKFQLTLICINLVIIAVVALSIWLQIERAFADLKVVGGLSGAEMDYYKRFVEYQATNLRQALLISTGVGLLIAFVATLLLSHRFVGPLVNIRGFFTRLAEGQSKDQRIQFREGDYLEDLPDTINRALDRVSAK